MRAGAYEAQRGRVALRGSAELELAALLGGHGRRVIGCGSGLQSEGVNNGRDSAPQDDDVQTARDAGGQRDGGVGQARAWVAEGRQRWLR